MSYGIKLRVWGKLAAFNRPEMKVERVSYEVITPSAARGVLEAIYWKPQMRWVVDRIHVLAPILFTHIRRNEIDSKIPVANARKAMRDSTVSLGISVADHRQQRAAMVLRDVSYGIEAHVEVLDVTDKDGNALSSAEAKHLEMFKRRATRGQYFHHPYLGCREFPANFELVDSFPPCPEALRHTRDLGRMLNDVVFVPDKKGPIVESNQGKRLRAQARFFAAVMEHGVIRVPAIDEMGART